MSQHIACCQAAFPSRPTSAPFSEFAAKPFSVRASLKLSDSPCTSRVFMIDRLGCFRCTIFPFDWYFGLADALDLAYSIHFFPGARSVILEIDRYSACEFLIVSFLSSILLWEYLSFHMCNIISALCSCFSPRLTLPLISECPLFNKSFLGFSFDPDHVSMIDVKPIRASR
jgi:hypothetical protein